VDSLKLLWVDMTIEGTAPEVPAGMAAYCRIVPANNKRPMDQQVLSVRPDAVVFDFDYPDKISLGMAERLKADHPSVPMVFLTVQHSEALAVWAFRSRFTDYLVRPVPDADVDRCLMLLQDIVIVKRNQASRDMPVMSVPMPDEVPAAVMSARSLLPALHFIESNLSSRLVAEDMARLCCMSPFRFGRAFKEAFVVSFRDYVVHLRLKEAARLLENPQAQVTQVAYAVGFNDLSHFSRMFRRQFGVTPSAAQDATRATKQAGKRSIEFPSLAPPELQPPG
jgi:AraC-like DNA-binding protein